MNSIGMFDNTKESLGDLLEEIHTGKAQLPDLTVGCGRQNILNLELADYQQFAPLTLAGFEQSAKF